MKKTPAKCPQCWKFERRLKFIERAAIEAHWGWKRETICPDSEFWKEDSKWIHSSKNIRKIEDKTKIAIFKLTFSTWR